MEPNSITDVDTKEKETMPDEHGNSPNVDTEFLIGTTLDGRYVIKRELGRGGFGVVYLASDEKVLSRLVVVKVLLDEKISHKWSVRKFKQEMEALARIDHPSVIGIFDSGQLADGRPYLVMQYVDGVSLRSVINVEGMDLFRAADIVRQIGKALSAAHDRGIFHRDLKPENIMLQQLADGDEQVKIIDFGVAKVKDSVISMSTASDRSAGTAAYMSPEQLCAGAITPASDVYGFGIIAYEMLTGRRPMNPDSAYQLLELQRSGVRIKPRELRPNLSDAAERIILKALSFEPENRYARARDFGDQLAAALLGEELQTELHPLRASKKDEALPLETAHLLFMDIVGYSKLLMDQQKESIRTLQEIVLSTEDCRRAESSNSLIRLPTGDGMALVFFSDPEAPVRCAVEISRALRAHPELELRMGVHTGLVYRIADINTNMNVAGGGINIAQRVMDCGDRGHILLSERVADDLGQLGRWSGCLQDLGIAEVKHGVKVHVFNLSGDDFGNPSPPTRIETVGKPFPKRAPVIAACSLAIITIAVAGAWLGLKSKAKPSTPVTNTAAVAHPGPEQSLSYWLTVQKMLNDKPLGKPMESVGNIIFGNGWRFRFNVKPSQPGALYLLNAGPGKTGAPEYNILFPLPQRNGHTWQEQRLDARLAADQTMQSDWYRFVDQQGVEKLWIIWSAQPIPELDEIFRQAAANKQNPGVVTDPLQIALIETYLKQYERERPEKVDELSKNLTSVKGWGNVVVSLVELRHAEV
ncbi:MAG TPA: protein kinase [Pyrinomonadaceae bacterium]|nr:protein kinase [Pyrinomonadaceae bacterium]